MKHRELTPIITLLAVSGIILALFILILWNIAETDAATTCTTYSENKTMLNNTAVETTYNDYCNDPSVICNSTVLGYPGEYTYNSPDGTVTLTNNTWNNTLCLVGYKYEDDTTNVQNSINEIKNALNNLVGWFSTIVLVLVASFILLVLIKGIGNQQTIR